VMLKGNKEGKISYCDLVHHKQSNEWPSLSCRCPSYRSNEKGEVQSKNMMCS